MAHVQEGLYYEISRAYQLIPNAGCRYEVVCVYLETLLRLEVTETESDEDGERKKWVQIYPNPYTCPYCDFKDKTYTSVANAATGIWQHCSTCAKDHLKVSDAGPKMPAFSMNIRDTIAIMEAKMTTYGGLDFEPNFEVILSGLLKEVLEQRYQAFQDLVTYHKVSQKVLKDGGGKPFGINVPLWRLIANGQMFNQRFMHPWHDMERFQEESDQCNALLDEWLADANATEPWGTLIIRKHPTDFPASTFSFSPNNRFGPARKLAHPQIHPTRFQRKPGDVMIHVPAKGPLPMGSFCGADGYGLIHPNLISAAVLQCCIASSQESTKHFKFDAMALAPNMDLLMSCKDAERVAQTIVQWNCGSSRTDKMELIKPPGGDMPKDVGTSDWSVHVRNEVRTVLSCEPFRQWTSVTVEQTQEQRRIDRDGVAKILKSTEHSLFGHMAMLTTQMGANLRAYHFLRNQELLGMKPVKKITLLQVKELIDQIVEWKWVNPAPISSYSKYLPSAGGDMATILKEESG